MLDPQIHELHADEQLRNSRRADGCLQHGLGHGNLSGRVILRCEDLSFEPPSGPRLPTARTYVSPAAGEAEPDGPLGPGWHMGLFSRIVEREDGAIRFEDGAGSWHEWIPGEGGLYAPAWPDLRQELTRDDQGGFVVTHPDRERWTFDPAGRLLEIRDRNDIGWEFAYDDAGRLYLVDDGRGRRLYLAYYPDDDPDPQAAGKLNLLVDLRDALQRRFHFGFHEGRLYIVSHSPYEGQDVVLSRYRYEAGRLWLVDDQHENVQLQFAYHSEGSWEGRLRSETFYDLRHTTYDYEAPGTVRLERTDLQDPSPSPRQYVFQHDERNNVLEIREPLDHVHRFAYEDPRNPYLLTWKKLPNGAEFHYSHNSRGNPTRIVDPFGHATTFEYAEDLLSAGELNPYHENLPYRTSRPGSAGHHEFSYDERGNLVGIVDPSGDEVVLERGPTGELWSRMENGTVTRYDYHPDGNLRVEVHPGEAPDRPRTVAYEWDGVDRVQTVTDPAGTWRYEHDPFGRTTLIENPDGGVLRFTYDRDRLAAAEMPPAFGAGGSGRTLGFQYDPRGRLQQVLADLTPGRPPQVLASYEYDGFDDLKVASRFLRGSLRGVQYTRDELGRVVSVVDPLDRRGSLLYESDPAAGTSRALETFPDGSGQGRTYDALGRLVEVTGNDGSVAFEYDHRNRLARMHAGGDDSARLGQAVYGLSLFGQASAGAKRSIEYVYESDDGDHLAEVRYDDGSRVRFAYSSGRLARLEDGLGRVTEYEYYPNGALRVVRRGGEAVEYEYDASGSLKRLRYPASTGVVAEFGEETPGGWKPGWNFRGQSTHVRYSRGQTILFESRCSHDHAGNPVALEEFPGDPNLRTVRHFRYDNLDRLVGSVLVEADGELRSSSQYTYDPSGLRLSRMSNARLLTYEYSAGGQLISIEQNGTPLSRYRFDARGRLTMRAQVTPVRRDDYGWTSAGRLAWHRDPEGTLTQHAYDPANRRNRTVDESGTLVYQHAAGPVVARWGGTEGGGVTGLSLLLGHEVLGFDDGDGPFYVVRDPLGLVRMVFDQEGTVRGSYRYDEMDRLESVSEAGVQSPVRRVAPPDSRCGPRLDAWRLPGGPHLLPRGNALPKELLQVPSPDRAYGDSPPETALHALKSFVQGAATPQQMSSLPRLGAPWETPWQKAWELERQGDLVIDDYQPTGAPTILRPSGEVEYTCDEDGWCTERWTDGRVRVFRPDGGLALERASDGTQTDYDDRGRILRVTFPDGRQAVWNWRVDGTAHVSYPDGQEEVVRPDGSLARRILPDGSVMVRDPDGRTVAEVDPQGRLTRYVFAADGSSRATRTDGQVSSFDADGRLVRTEAADGSVQFRAEDGTTTLTLRNGLVHTSGADGGQTWLLPDGTRVTSAGDVLLATDAEGLPMPVVRTQEGWIEVVDEARIRQVDDTLTLRILTPGRELLEQVDPDGTVTTWASGRLAEERLPDGTVRTFGADGDLREVSSGEGRVLYNPDDSYAALDSDGRVLSITRYGVAATGVGSAPNPGAWRLVADEESGQVHHYEGSGRLQRIEYGPARTDLYRTDGSREVVQEFVTSFYRPDGTLERTVETDGTTFYLDEDLPTRTEHLDGSVSYYDASGDPTYRHYLDGSRHFFQADGSRARRTAAGALEGILLPDGLGEAVRQDDQSWEGSTAEGTYFYRSDGSPDRAELEGGIEVHYEPDGTVVQISEDQVVTSHPDGRVKTENSDGTAWTEFPDGAVESVREFGVSTRFLENGDEVTRFEGEPTLEVLRRSVGSIEARLPGGFVLTRDVRRQVWLQAPGEDGPVRYEGPQPYTVTVEPGIRLVWHPDGTFRIEWPDGSYSQDAPGGLSETRLPDGTVTRTWPSGSQEVLLEDGDRTLVLGDGSVWRWSSSGALEVAVLDRIRVYRDESGAVRIEDPEGRATLSEEGDAFSVRVQGEEGAGDGLYTWDLEGGVTVEYDDDEYEDWRPDGTFIRMSRLHEGPVTLTPDGARVYESSDGTVTLAPSGDRSLVRSDGFQEVRRADGSVTRILPDRVRVDLGGDGRTLTYTLTDGSSITRTAAGVLQVAPATNSTLLGRDEEGDWTTVLPSTGERLTWKSSGEIVTTRRDGSQFVQAPNGDLHDRRDGTVRTELSTGQRLILAAGDQQRTLGDGSVLTLKEDGAFVLSRKSGEFWAVDPQGKVGSGSGSRTTSTQFTTGLAFTSSGDGRHTLSTPSGHLVEYEDGTPAVFRLGDGSVVQRTPQGLTGTVTENSTGVELGPDGTILYLDLGEFKVTRGFSDGVEFYTYESSDGVDVTEFRDGRITERRADRFTIWYPNGDVRVDHDSLTARRVEYWTNGIYEERLFNGLFGELEKITVVKPSGLKIVSDAEGIPKELWTSTKVHMVNPDGTPGGGRYMDLAEDSAPALFTSFRQADYHYKRKRGTDGPWQEIPGSRQLRAVGLNRFESQISEPYPDLQPSPPRVVYELHEVLEDHPRLTDVKKKMDDGYCLAVGFYKDGVQVIGPPEDRTIVVTPTPYVIPVYYARHQIEQIVTRNRVHLYLEDEDGQLHKIDEKDGGGPDYLFAREFDFRVDGVLHILKDEPGVPVGTGVVVVLERPAKPETEASFWTLDPGPRGDYATRVTYYEKTELEPRPDSHLPEAYDNRVDLDGEETNLVMSDEARTRLVSKAPPPPKLPAVVRPESVQSEDELGEPGPVRFPSHVITAGSKPTERGTFIERLLEKLRLTGLRARGFVTGLLDGFFRGGLWSDLSGILDIAAIWDLVTHPRAILEMAGSIPQLLDWQILSALFEEQLQAFESSIRQYVFVDRNADPKGWEAEYAARMVGYITGYAAYNLAGGAILKALGTAGKLKFPKVAQAIARARSGAKLFAQAAAAGPLAKTLLGMHQRLFAAFQGAMKHLQKTLRMAPEAMRRWVDHFQIWLIAKEQVVIKLYRYYRDTAAEGIALAADARLSFQARELIRHRPGRWHPSRLHELLGGLSHDFLDIIDVLAKKKTGKRSRRHPLDKRGRVFEVLSSRSLVNPGYGAGRSEAIVNEFIAPHFRGNAGIYGKPDDFPVAPSGLIGGAIECKAWEIETWRRAAQEAIASPRAFARNGFMGPSGRRQEIQLHKHRRSLDLLRSKDPDAIRQLTDGHLSGVVDPSQELYVLKVTKDWNDLPEPDQNAIIDALRKHSTEDGSELFLVVEVVDPFSAKDCDEIVEIVDEGLPT